MGLAASQTRFLSLTSRKGDLEFQGQQVNQARSNLAQQTAGVFEQMLNLRVPTAPNPASNKYVAMFTVFDPNDPTQTIQTKGQIFEFDTEDEYNIAQLAYERDKDAYDKEYANLNAQTNVIQQQDRTLEVQLKNIDTQHSAVQTEIDAVKKVIDKNIEMTFKTFA